MGTDATRSARRHPLQTAALLVGVTFVAVGILGFIPWITQDYDQMDWIGQTGGELLAVFGVNWTHNLLHIALGVPGVLAAGIGAALSRTYLLVGGLGYLGLMAYGFAIDLDSSWNFAALNTADNWLHLGLATAMIVLGLVLRPPARGRVEDVDRIGPARAGSEVRTDAEQRRRERLTRR